MISIDIPTAKIMLAIILDIYISKDSLLQLSNIQVVLMSGSVILWKHRIEHWYIKLHKSTMKGKEATGQAVVFCFLISFVPWIGLIVIIGILNRFFLDYDNAQE